MMGVTLRGDSTHQDEYSKWETKGPKRLPNRKRVREFRLYPCKRYSCKFPEEEHEIVIWGRRKTHMQIVMKIKATDPSV